MESEKRQKERARQLRIGLDAVERIHEDKLQQFAKSALMAHHVFHSDWEDGLNDDSRSEFYQFTEAQKNRFIAHTREDAALAAYVAHDSYQEIRRTRILLIVSTFLNAFTLGVLLYSLLSK